MSRDAEFTPEACQGKDAQFKGSVKLERPTVSQRYRYISQCGFKTNDKGDVELGMDAIGPMAEMIELSEPHYKDVKIERLSDGQKFGSYEDLALDPDCDAILIEVAGKILGGFGPAKNSKGVSARK